jgi:hypothetical protein
MVEFVQVRVRENTCPGAGTRVPFGRMKDVKRSGGKRGNGGTTDLLGAGRIMIPGGHPVVRVTGAPAELSELAAEFPGYEFATQQTWDGISIIARRHGGGARPGLYAVVASDLDEMRRVLLEQERPS